jgi:hypothetical protein
MTEKISNYDDFWLFYLREHSRPATRALHYVGTTAGLGLLVAGILGHPRLLPLAPIIAYSLAWYAHFEVERNRPATFTHPLWSLISDVRMLGLFVTGRLDRELGKASARPS